MNKIRLTASCPNCGEEITILMGDKKKKKKMTELERAEEERYRKEVNNPPFWYQRGKR